MYDQSPGFSGALRTGLRPAAQKTSLNVAILTDDPETARALLIACEQTPSFDCRVRIGALVDGGGLVARAGEVVIFDMANAPERRFDPTMFPDAPCIALAHDAGDFDGCGACVEMRFADLSPSALETALRSALRVQARLATADDMRRQLERRLEDANARAAAFVEEIAPAVCALEGVLEIMQTEGVDDSRFGLVSNWTRDLSALLSKRQDELSGENGARVDLCAMMDRLAPQFEKGCAARNQTLVLSAPPAPLLARADAKSLSDAVRNLLASVVEREGRDRRIEILLWRSLDEARLAIVAGPMTRRGDDNNQAASPSAAPREVTAADRAFFSALGCLREIGATVDLAAKCAVGSTIMVALPAAG
ncbi:MAG: hypothetical protein KGM42_15755 [Hyphomicrobiales bacterium]|nr:hypothetical protein [Hyphomicrobiales bacterium]